MKARVLCLALVSFCAIDIFAGCASERKALSRDDILRALNEEPLEGRPLKQAFTLDDARALYWRLPERPKSFVDSPGALKDERLLVFENTQSSLERASALVEVQAHRCLSGVLLEKEKQALAACAFVFDEGEGKQRSSWLSLMQLAAEREREYETFIERARQEASQACFENDDDACDHLLSLDNPKAFRGAHFSRSFRGKGRVALYLKGAAGADIRIGQQPVAAVSDNMRIVFDFAQGTHTLTLRASKALELRVVKDETVQMFQTLDSSVSSSVVEHRVHDFVQQGRALSKRFEALKANSLVDLDTALLLVLANARTSDDAGREVLRFRLAQKFGFAPQVLAYLLRTSEGNQGDARVGIWQRALKKLNGEHSATKITRSSSAREKLMHLSSSDRRFRRAAVALKRFDKVPQGFDFESHHERQQLFSNEKDAQREAWLKHIAQSSDEGERKIRIERALESLPFEKILWRLAFGQKVSKSTFPNARDLMLDEAPFENEGTFRDERLFVDKKGAHAHLQAGRFRIADDPATRSNLSLLELDLLGAEALVLRVKKGQSVVDVDPSELSALSEGDLVEYLVIKTESVPGEGFAIKFSGEVKTHRLALYIHKAHEPQFGGLEFAKRVTRDDYEGVLYEGPKRRQELSAPEEYAQVGARISVGTIGQQRSEHPFLESLVNALKGKKAGAVKAEVITEFVFSNIREGAPRDSIATLLRGEGDRDELLMSLLKIAGEAPQRVVLFDPLLRGQEVVGIRLRRFLDDVYIFSAPQSFGKIPRRYLGYTLTNDQGKSRTLGAKDLSAARVKTTLTLSPNQYLGVESRWDGIVTIAVPATLAHAYRWPFLNKSALEQKAEFESILAQVVPGARVVKVAFSQLDSSTRAFGIGAQVVFGRGPFEVRDTFVEVVEGRLALNEYLGREAERESPLLLPTNSEEIEIVATLTPQSAFVQGPESERSESEGVILVVESTVSDTSWRYRRSLSLERTLISADDFRVWRRQTKAIVYRSAIRFDLALEEDKQ